MPGPRPQVRTVGPALTAPARAGILRAAGTATMPLKRISSLILLLFLAGIAGAASDPAIPTRAREQAAALYQRSLGWLAHDTVETRRQAVQALEEATVLDPGNATYELALARAYYHGGQLRNARQRFERVARIQPGDAAGHRGLGLIWRRDWLKYLDRRSLDRAVEHLETAARLDSGNTDAWLTLAPLRVEQGDLAGALRAAFRALRSDPGRSEARLAVAHALYRSGMLREADSVFGATIPRLGTRVRERYEDISPVATEQDTALLRSLPRADKAAFVERFWRENDPDLTTAENEARLEYWSRVTQAYFLFFDVKRGGWDERGEVYVRYGPPAEMQYNPLGGKLSWAFGTGPESAARTCWCGTTRSWACGGPARTGCSPSTTCCRSRVTRTPTRCPIPTRWRGARTRSARAAGAACSTCFRRARSRCRSRASWPASRAAPARACSCSSRCPEGRPTACGPTGPCSTRRGWCARAPRSCSGPRRARPRPGASATSRPISSPAPTSSA